MKCLAGETGEEEQRNAQAGVIEDEEAGREKGEREGARMVRKTIVEEVQRGGTESRETGEEREGAGAAKERWETESISSAREERQEERRWGETEREI